ncbi:hypothetical protein BJX99DRAFT_263889 [Aspergillus californicus]
MASPLTPCPHPSNNPSSPSLLVLFLTDWDDDDKETLIDRLQPALKDIDITKWHPYEDRARKRKRRVRHNQDSQANIYALAIATFRAGWSEFVVADGLTSRQIDPDYEDGENEMISVVGVAIRAGQQDEVRVIARRVRITDQEEGDFLSLGALKDLGLLKGELENTGFDRGMILHDPDKGVFAADTISTADDGPRSIWPYDCEKPTIPASVPTGRQDLNIFLLFETSPEQLQKMQAVIEQATDNQAHGQGKTKTETEKSPKVYLVPWERTQFPSRRDILCLWDAYTHHIDHPDTMHFLLQPIQDSISSNQLLTVYNQDGPLVLAKNTLTTVINEFQHPSTRLADTSTLFKQTQPDSAPEDMELIFPPDYPFYPSPVPWYPVDRSLNSVPLFYLTNTFTTTQHRKLESEIQTLTDVDVPEMPKICCFVPYSEPQDLNDEDVVPFIWKTHWSMKSYESTQDYCEPPYFFIDKQSALDNTILVMKPDYYFGMNEDAHAQELLRDIVFPEIRGFLYGRIAGRDAHVVWANLRIANMGFEDFFEGREDEMFKAERPGWPGHGVLRNIDSDVDEEDTGIE